MTTPRIAELAARLGAVVPSPAASTVAFDLREPGPLLTLDDHELELALTSLSGQPASEPPTEPTVALRAELARFTRSDAPVAIFHDAADARGRVTRAARTRDQSVVLVIGGSVLGIEAPVEALPFDQLATATARIHALAGTLAAVVLEPRGELAELRAIATAARAANSRLVLDETRTAARLAARTVSGEAGLDGDAILLGDSLSCGLPFAAVIGLSDSASTCEPFTAIVVRAALQRLVAAEVHEALSRAGTSLRTRFAAACRAHDIRARMIGPAALLRIVFDDQENAQGGLIAHHFRLELSALEVHADHDVALPVELSAPDADRIARAFDGAIARIRTLLIEHNSFLSGGLPWVFPGGHALFRTRGLAKYRYPKLGPTTIEPASEHSLRIRFEAGQLGPITSSGFYLPARLRGDLDVRIHFTLHDWQPGPDSACLGLFFQNERSTARYYAQLMSTSDLPGELSVAAGLEGRLEGRRTIDVRSGWLRLVRIGDTLIASWRPDAQRDSEELEWTELGRRCPGTRDDVIVGCKIWSKLECGGLEAELTALTIEAEVPDDQLPALEVRPDPRLAQHP